MADPSTDGWVLHAPPPKPSPTAGWTLHPPQHFESDSSFSDDLNRRIGAGRWRDSGDYRDPSREDALRQRGAGTVPPGHLSSHSLGAPGAPGAHDFVAPGFTLAQVRAALADDPTVKDVIYEGPHGSEGGHFHVDMRDEPGWTLHDSPAPAAANHSGWTLHAPPGQGIGAGVQVPHGVGAGVQPTDQWDARVARVHQGLGLESNLEREARETGKGMADALAPPTQPDYGRATGVGPGRGLVGNVVGETAHRFQEGLQAANPFHDAAPWLDPAAAMLNPAGAAGAILSPVGGAAAALREETPAAQHESVAEQRRKANLIGDIAESVTPIPGAAEVRGLTEGLRGGTEGALRLGPELGTAEAEQVIRHGAEPRTAPERAPVRSIAASTRDQPPRTDIVGDETNPATRTANALYRLGGHDIASRIELGRADQALRKKHGPEVDEALYHHLEEKLGYDPIPGEARPEPPGDNMSAAVAAAKRDLDPYLQRQTEVINRLRARNDPTVDEYLTDQGYVHRIKADDDTPLDENQRRSPFESRKSLVKHADSQKQRKFIVLENPETGERIFPKGQDEPKNPYAEYRPGQEMRAPGTDPHGGPGTVYRVRQPTTAEIEANTNVRYQKSAIHNTLVNIYQLERAERNLDILEQTLQDMKERGVAHQEEWYRPGEEAVPPSRHSIGGNGPPEDERIEPETRPARILERNPNPTPKGFVSIPDIPQFKGWKFDPNDAQTQELRDWLPDTQRSWAGKGLDYLDAFSNFMLRSNFLSPIVHPLNVSQFWITSRGMDWFLPEGYARLARTLPRAAKEVVSMGPIYRKLLREGSALLSADSRTQKFTTLLTDEAGKQMIHDPSSFATLKRVFGDAVTTPAKLYQAFQNASHKGMWMASDVMMMQRILENMDKRLSIGEAIRKTEEVIPNYRVPAQAVDNPLVGRTIHNVFSNNRLFAVGRYHYNKLAAWGRMFRKLAKGTAEERTEVLGQFLAMGAMTAVAWLVNEGVKIATGNPNGRFKPGGITSYPDAAYRIATGQEDAAQAIAGIIDVSPAAQLGLEEIRQKDYYGNDVLSKFKSPAQNIGGELNLPLSQFGPIQGLENSLNPRYGPERVAGNAFGLDLPKRPPGAVRASTAKRLRRQAEQQDQGNPTVQGLRALGVP